ncbi:MAG: hypothetical protein Q7S22_03245, partial [Candidatus Micrarchaeota archaeon]|nr:hypothetical protein [Candidatus Micrarchaeota archaeon]
MYTPLLEKLLKKLNISIGDTITVESPKGTYQGILMPRTYESDILVIKLDNGYNVGVRSEDTKIALFKKMEKNKLQKLESVSETPKQETHTDDLPIRPPQPKGCGFIGADANVATATLRPLSKGQLGGQSCVNSALPP